MSFTSVYELLIDVDVPVRVHAYLKLCSLCSPCLLQSTSAHGPCDHRLVIPLELLVHSLHWQQDTLYHFLRECAHKKPHFFHPRTTSQAQNTPETEFTSCLDFIEWECKIWKWLSLSSVGRTYSDRLSRSPPLTLTIRSLSYCV
jgi:hypothetical protein